MYTFVSITSECLEPCTALESHQTGRDSLCVTCCALHAKGSDTCTVLDVEPPRIVASGMGTATLAK